MQQAEMRPCSPAPSSTPRLDDLLHELSGGLAAYVAIFTAEPLERIALARSGVPATVLTALSEAMDVSRDMLYRWTGIPRATGNRKVKNNERLSLDEGERVLGLVKLVGQVHKIVVESGDPQGFDAARWTASWLETESFALGGLAPGALMDTAEGRSLVYSAVGQMQSGTYM